jgi:peptidyl-prolyl cis-trans isomerase D
VSPATRTAVGYAIVKVLEQIPAGLPPVAEIKERVTEAIKRERAEARALEKAKALVAVLAKGGEFRAAARLEGFTTGDLGPFTLAEPPKDREALPNGVFLAAVQTAAGQVAEPVAAGSGVYVVKTLERQLPDPAGFLTERPEVEKQVLEQKRSLAWENWIRNRLVAAKIEVGGEKLPSR